MVIFLLICCNIKYSKLQHYLSCNHILFKNGWLIIIIITIIIITEMIFMVLSSWQSHCKSSPGSFDECRLSANVAANPQTKLTDLDCESARKKWQLPSTSTIAILLLFSPRADTHFTVPRRVEGWVDLGTAVRVYSPCPRLYIAVAVVINTTACGEIRT